MNSLFDGTDNQIMGRIAALVASISDLSPIEQIAAINEARFALHEISPFRNEPVDCVLWIPSDGVEANDYNPNKVAPPEFKLLETSILNDGYTQPVVTWRDGDRREVVDGFHRNRVGRESEDVRKRIMGYLPVVTINQDRVDKGDRIAATIRHNRARGKHQVAAMSDIVVELKRRNWTDEKIGKELGMDPDEVLRLCQITGLAEMFANKEFTASWDLDTESTEESGLELQLTEQEVDEEEGGEVECADSAK